MVKHCHFRILPEFIMTSPAQNCENKLSPEVIIIPYAGDSKGELSFG